jgi:HK97 family phage major capsid protein
MGKPAMQHRKRHAAALVVNLVLGQEPSSVNEKNCAVRGARHLLQTTNIDSLPIDQRKALTSFNVGQSGFILPPEMSSTILSCLVDQTDLAGVMNNVTISGASIKYLVDNVEFDQAQWACDVDCWGATHVANMAAGLSELEIKPELLRYVVCASRDLLEDSSVDIENWLLTKISRAVRATLSTALISGNGIGKPMGILNPAAGIPICDTGAATPAGVFSWQDLVSLKWQVPVQFHGPGSAYLMNQQTFSQVLTMSDSNNRPIMIADPTQPGQYLINGSPVILSTQMPDTAAGATPVAFGNWNSAYTVVNRKAVTMLQDPLLRGLLCALQGGGAGRRCGDVPQCRAVAAHPLTGRNTMLATSMLGVPVRITGNPFARIRFRGNGHAQFRLQHGADRNGQPDDLSWCDVSNLSNGRLATPADAIDAHSMVMGGVLVDVVNGDLDILYRRHTADWIRVVPLDEDDADNIERCAGYEIAIEPLA